MNSPLTHIANAGLVPAARVLVVDDNAVSRKKMRMAVDSLGHDVSVAENGNRALQMLQVRPFRRGASGHRDARRLTASTCWAR